MREALRAGDVSADTIKQRLTECRGDLFLSASLLGCTAQELDRYIRADDALQAFVASIETVKQSGDYDKLSADQFERELRRLSLTNKVMAVEEIAKLAAEPISTESAAQNRVKLQACMALAGSGPQGPGTNEQQALLEELNTIYRQEAPRITEIRQTVITLKSPSPSLPSLESP